MGASLPLGAPTRGQILTLISGAPYEVPEAFYVRLPIASRVNSDLYLLRIFITER